jgi:flagellar motor switch protein FliG
MSTAILGSTQVAPSDINKMTRMQKLAALLVVIGPDSAAEILKSFEPQDVAAIASAITQLPTIDQRLQVEILREFSQVAVSATTTARGGIKFAHATLEKALGSTQARQVMSRVAPSQATESPLHQLLEREARQIYGALKSEQPQTIALVLSFLDHKKASEILNLLDDDTRAHVIERLAMLSPTPAAIVETLAEWLLKKIGTTTTLAFNQTGGVEPAATMLKALHRDASKVLLAAIETRNPDICLALRNQMFTFEDVAKIAAADLQKILREVDSRLLATALKPASDALKSKILSGLSKRAAEAIEEEIGFLGKVKAKDVEMAQRSIIEIVRRLEAEGQIEISQEAAA